MTIKLSLRNEHSRWFVYHGERGFYIYIYNTRTHTQLYMTADSRNLRDFLQCMGLIKVAWEKSNMCLGSNMWEKRAFQSSYVLIDHLCSWILFLKNCIGFHRCNVWCDLCMGWSICLRERWFHCWFVLWGF